MTEAEWRACEDPGLMFEFRRGGSDTRKDRQFAVECFRRLHDLLPSEGQRAALLVLEQLAEGRLTHEARRNAMIEARRAIPFSERNTVGETDDPQFVGLMLYRALITNAGGHAAQAAGGRGDYLSEQRAQCVLLRDIFGNPFRPVTFDAAWRTFDVTALATGIYDEKAFERLPILADALQDAECDSDDLLNHLRDTNATHVRGCWALDIVLGKE